MARSRETEAVGGRVESRTQEKVGGGHWQGGTLSWEQGLAQCLPLTLALTLTIFKV